MKNTDSKSAQPLNVNTMPLHGVHLIEASAGTGKTFNITRIYLRLLLEKKLTVDQILVMTFTKDATEEIRGRIDEFLRTSLNDWSELVTSDPYFEALSKNVTEEQAKLLIRKALLFIDEASIFTIHGFCQQVLSQHAFASGLAFNATLEGEQSELLLQSSRDWYRKLAKHSVEEFNSIVEFWPTPEVFNRQFYRAFSHQGQLHVDLPNSISDQFKQLAANARAQLDQDRSFLFSLLVENKKGEEKEQRIQEFEQLTKWLQDISVSPIERLTELHAKSMPDKFLDGKRYARSKEKEAINESFAYAKKVKAELKYLATKIAKASALAVAKQGIEFIAADTEDKKNKLNSLSFDDLIVKLSHCLQGEDGKKGKSKEESKALLKRLLREQFPFALIDEFQDTDQHQYSIVNALYGKGQQEEFATSQLGLVMIGDPKQAIYGFRGSDIFTYLQARQSAEHLWVMDTNWRSSASMINGYNRLFYGNNLSQESANVFGYGIDYLPVKPSPKALAEMTEKLNSPAISLVHFPTEEKKLTQSFRTEMANWCANEIKSLLQSGEAQSQDIALLVRDGVEGAELKAALLMAGLDSVYLSDRTNLWHSEQTKELISVLNGVLFLEDDRQFNASLATRLMGYSAKDLFDIQQNDIRWQDKKQAFADLRADWHRKGFISMALKLLHEHFDFAHDTFERSLTNLLHLFELLQAKSQKLLNPQELVHWFENQASAEFPEQETETRLASEENLIKIITQHGSKGLEYPIVFVPFATRYKNPLRFGSRSLDLYDYHNESGQHIISLSGNNEALSGVEKEANAESIRLFYVAITRAEQKCYLLAAPFDNFHLSPMGLTFKWQKDTDIGLSLSALVSEQANDFSLATVTEIGSPERTQIQESELHEVSAAVFSGKIERDWWLSSFTSLSRNLINNGRMSRQNEIDDTHSTVLTNLTQSDAPQHIRYVLEKGARTGNFLHDIFENVKFNNPDWQSATLWPLKRFGELPSHYSYDDLIVWLESVLSASLITEKNHAMLNEADLSLSVIKDEQCLKEVEFYFPIDEVETRLLSKILLNHRQRVTSDNLQPYGSVLPSFPSLGKLKGMMHGYIDLVFEYNGKFYVADYKSNFLGDNSLYYQHEYLVKDVQSHHYDLQYLIYSIALHRYLKNAIPSYNIKEHFGGVFYLYLRGMGCENEHESGVYYSDIKESELVQLDELFANENQTEQLSNSFTQTESIKGGVSHGDS